MARKKAPVGSLLKRGLAKTYISEWREHRALTQERLAERVGELLGTSITSATISRIENSKSPYSQRQLEAIAESLGCEPADLLMRNPLQDSAWSLLEALKPETRLRAIDLLKLLKLQDEQSKAA